MIELVEIATSIAGAIVGLIAIPFYFSLIRECFKSSNKHYAGELLILGLLLGGGTIGTQQITFSIIDRPDLFIYYLYGVGITFVPLAFAVIIILIIDWIKQ